MIKIVIFDVDDTLLNSGEIVAKAYIKVAENLNLRIPAMDEALKLNGLPGNKIIEGLWPDIDNKSFEKEYDKVKVNKYFLFPDAVETVSLLVKKSFRLGILTSREIKSLKERFSKTDLKLSDFRYITTTSHTKYHKPDPRVFDLLKEQLKEEGFKKEEVLYIGDSMYDYKAAKGAGIEFLAVLTGAWTREDFVGEGLDERMIINKLREIEDILSSSKIF